VGRSAAFGFCLGCALAAAGKPALALPSHVDVRAGTIGLYAASPPVLAASGKVRVHIGPLTVAADALRYDLGKNRLVASGNVDVSSPSGTLRAAAYALDVATGNASAVLLDSAQPEAVNLAPHEADGVVGRAPAGAFDVPDLTGQKPYVRGPHASIVPGASVRFAPAHVLTDLGTSVPSPSYLFSFATNPSFAQQSLPASTFDQPYGLFGTPNSLLSLHALYNQGTGLGLGIDEHLVNGSKSYLVASVIPTIEGGRIDLVGFEQLTPAMSQQVIASRQDGYASVIYQLLHNERATVTSLTLDQILGLETADVRVSSLSRPIGHLLTYKLAADVGYDHDNGMLPLASDARGGLEALLTTPTVRGPLGTSFSASLDAVRTIYNFPRETGTSVLSTFASKALSPSLHLIGQVQFAQVNDRYRNDQSFFYPALTPTLPDGTIYYGYAAYNGASTLRTYSLTTTYSPNANVNLQVSLIHHRDFPQFDGYGNPPYSLGFDVRVRPWAGGPAIDLGRGYLFDWGGQRFTPAYTLSIAP
jgi:hypothetical protein